VDVSFGKTHPAAVYCDKPCLYTDALFQAGPGMPLMLDSCHWKPARCSI